jgi:hypothetical protein
MMFLNWECPAMPRSSMARAAQDKRDRRSHGSWIMRAL